MEWTSQFAELISNYGYLVMFICCAIGLFVFPAPNEVLLMIAGWLVATSQLVALPTFVTLYLAVLCHGTLLFMFGMRINHLSKQGKHVPQRWTKIYQSGHLMVNRHGHRALFISYFVPFLRHAVPLGVGASVMSFKRFAYTAFPTAAVWLTIYFMLGFYSIQLLQEVQQIIEHVGWVVIIGLGIASIMWLRKLKKASVSE